MSRPFFIAETPRAGQFGHCFIVPPGSEHASARVADFCRAATQHTAGQNFVAARHRVEQRLTTGVVRPAVEILVLAGVEYAQLTDAQKQRLGAVLARRLSDLAQLIDRIAWEQERQGMMVTRQELADWVHADRLEDLPLAREHTRPLLAHPHNCSQAPMQLSGRFQRAQDTVSRVLRPSAKIAALLGSVVLVALLIGMMAAWGPKAVERIWVPSPHRPQLTPSNPEFELFARALNDLAAACGQPSETFVAAMYHARYPLATSALSADQMRNELFQNLRVWEVVEQHRRTGEVNPYMFFDDKDTTKALREYVGNGLSKVEIILPLRRHLAMLGKAFVDFRAKIGEAGVDKLPDDAPFAKFIGYVASLQCTTCGHIEPVSPFFEKPDTEVLSVFRTLLVQERTLLREVLPEQEYRRLYGGEVSLRSVLDVLSTYQKQVSARIAAERDWAEEQSRDNAILVQRTKAYRSLESFLRVLGAKEDLPLGTTTPPSQ
jgi:hypothetical protein